MSEVRSSVQHLKNLEKMVRHHVFPAGSCFSREDDEDDLDSLLANCLHSMESVDAVNSVPNSAANHQEEPLYGGADGTDPLDRCAKTAAWDVGSKNDMRVDSLPKSMSLPLHEHAAPDPFPELANSPVTPSVSLIRMDSCKSSPSSPLLRRGSPVSPSKHKKVSPRERRSSDVNEWRPQAYNKMLFNFHNDDHSFKTVLVDEGMCAIDICNLLALKNHTTDDKNWCIVERINKLNIERSLEDHEVVADIHQRWGHNEDNRFYFSRDYTKYVLFQNPAQFFPLHMLDTNESLTEVTGGIDRQKNILLQNFFSNPDRLPDIQGYLYLKEGKRSWRKHYFVLQNSGLYYSTKGTSKEAKHLQLVSHLQDMHVYVASNAKKNFGAPNNFCLCLKPLYSVSDVRELKCLCAEDEQSRMCWLTGMRLVKFGQQLWENYKAAIKREEKLKSIENKPTNEGNSENLYVKSRVAMDFTGTGGRVVDDPNEALGVAIEEGQEWRRKVSKVNLCSSPATSGTGSLPSETVGRPIVSFGTAAVHLTQPWFHCDITREEAVNLITRQGLVDGVYLVRQSQHCPGTYVLSLAHNQKVKHCQIVKMEEDGEWFFTPDKGHTKFTDLIQLVSFYRLNAGGLPTKLTHYVTRLA